MDPAVVALVEELEGAIVAAADARDQVLVAVRRTPDVLVYGAMTAPLVPLPTVEAPPCRIHLLSLNDTSHLTP